MFARYAFFALLLVSFSGSDAHAADYEWSWTGALVMRDAYDWDAVTGLGLTTAMINSTWDEEHENRSEIVQFGVLGADAHHCGDDAHRRYNVAPGDAWCSEFARTVLLSAGARQEICNSNGCEDLPYDIKVEDFEEYFRNIGGWTAQKYVTGYQIQPGDYIAFNLNGETANHSGVVVAVSNDHRWIWSAEGNVHDCTELVRHDYVVDGVVSSSIYGIGEADKMF